MNFKLEKAVLIAAVAGLMGHGASLRADDAAAPAAGAADAKVECHGVNACKGKGECGSKEEGHGCAGLNSCKGKGWISLTQKECDARKAGAAKGGKSKGKGKTKTS
ncbi:MAG: hypothetical protein AB7P04_03595 [Bacteriovoracia bacterium]